MNVELRSKLQVVCGVLVLTAAMIFGSAAPLVAETTCEDGQPRFYYDPDYLQYRQAFEDGDAEFDDIVSSDIDIQGVISDEDAGRELADIMQPVFEFLKTPYCVAEAYEETYYELQLAAWQRLFQVARLVSMEIDMSDSPILFWGREQIGPDLYSPLMRTFECIKGPLGETDGENGLLLPFNYLKTAAEIAAKNDALGAAMATHYDNAEDRASIYNQLVMLLSQAVALQNFAVGLLPSFPIVEEGQVEGEISLLEKKVLYKGLNQFNSMAQAQIKSGTVDEVVSHFPLPTAFDIVSGVASIIDGVHDQIDLFDYMNAAFDDAWALSRQIVVNAYGPPNKGGVAWANIQIDNTRDPPFRAWVPQVLYNEIDTQIGNLADAILANLAAIKTFPTVMEASATIDFIPVHAWAYLDFQVVDADALDAVPDIDLEKPADRLLLEIPDSTEVTYRCTFPGLEAQPEFWENAETLEIRIDGDIPPGWQGIELLRKVVPASMGGFKYEVDDVAFLGPGEATETGRRWRIDFRGPGERQFAPWRPDDATDRAWFDGDAANSEWRLPWHFFNGQADEYGPVFVRVKGKDGLTLKTIQLKLEPEIAYLQGQVSDGSGDPVLGDIAFYHDLTGSAAASRLTVANTIDTDGSYFVALPFNQDATDYRIAVNGQICNLDPLTISAPVQGDDQDITVGEGRPAALVVESPAFDPPAYQGDLMHLTSPDDVAAISGFIDFGCSEETPKLYFRDVSAEADPVQLGLSPRTGEEGQFDFSHAINWTPDDGRLEFELQIKNAAEKAVLGQLFEIHPPTAAQPEIRLGDGIGTFEMERLTAVGQTLSIPLRLINVGTAAPEISYFSVSASPGLDIFGVTYNGETIAVNPENEVQKLFADTYSVNNYPAGSTIWQYTGDTMTAEYQLVDVKGEQAPAPGETHQFTFILVAAEAAIDQAQWFQFRAAFKGAEQDSWEYQTIAPDWEESALADQQGWPVLRVEAEPVPYVADRFADDPAASVDTDNDGHPDYWDPTASAADIAASGLTIDAFPNDPARWAFATGSSGSTDIVAAEYFIDQDPGVGLGTAITAVDAVLDQPFEFFNRYNVATTGLSIGLHTVSVRTRNSAGHWSPARTAFFEIIQPKSGAHHTTMTDMDYWLAYTDEPAASEETLKVTQAEMFFGSDPGVGLGIQLKPVDDAFDDLSEQFDVEALLPDSVLFGDTIRLSVRVRDAHGQWSPLNRIWLDRDQDADGVSDAADAFADDPAAALDADGDGYPDKWNPGADAAAIAQSTLLIDAYPDDPTRYKLPPDLAYAEYFIDQDPGLGKGYIVLPTDGAADQAFEFLQRYSISTQGLVPGVHTLNVRVKDADGTWSALSTAAFEIIRPQAGTHIPLPENGGFGDLPDIPTAEYFIGSDPGAGNGIPIVPPEGMPAAAAQYTVDISDTESLTGMQVLGVRVQDENGTWSPLGGGVLVFDAFPEDPNEVLDTDGDGIGDNEDPDDDDDGAPDEADAFPKDPAEWEDTDGDGAGDNADLDDDDDDVPDAMDAFPKDPAEWADTDGDGTGDNADLDDDGDEVQDEADMFPKDPAEWEDTDADGTGDNADPDDDDDGLSDEAEAERGTDPKAVDTDGDGISDGWEVDYGLDPLVDDALLDADEDGWSNLAEFLRGTDPNGKNARALPWLNILLE